MSLKESYVYKVTTKMWFRRLVLIGITPIFVVVTLYLSLFYAFKEFKERFVLGYAEAWKIYKDTFNIDRTIKKYFKFLGVKK